MKTPLEELQGQLLILSKKSPKDTTQMRQYKEGIWAAYMLAGKMLPAEKLYYQQPPTDNAKI